MDTKEELVNNIKKWVKLSEEISGYQCEIKERKMKMKTITDSLLTTMKKNELDCVDIKGGSLMYKQNKVKKPINGKSLIKSLNDYFNGSNPSKAEDITKFILENREVVVKEIIKHKVDTV